MGVSITCTLTAARVWVEVKWKVNSPSWHVWPSRLTGQRHRKSSPEARLIHVPPDSHGLASHGLERRISDSHKTPVNIRTRLWRCRWLNAITGIEATWWAIHDFLLVVCSNDVSILHLFRYITTCVVYVTGCDLDKSFRFNKTVAITSHVRSPIHV